ncbi:hypothetical protein VTK56DRAFT_3226 [Thermocarpiscus australiensis]
MASEQPPLEPPPSPPRVPAAPVPEQTVMKLTRGHSCVLCQQRKVRCDKQKPCGNCIKAQVECRVVPPQPPRRRKKKPHERDLIERLRKYESLLSQHGVSFEPIAHELKPSDHADDVADLEQDLNGLKTSPSSTADHVSPDHQVHDKQKWIPFSSEYRGADDDEPSDSDYEGPTIHHAYDAMFDNNDGFPFVVGGSPASVTKAHPSAIQIFQLWQIYINNVNPLLKITHTPTLQAQIISAGANTAKISKPLEALMFAIYFSAITSMTEEEVQSTFAEDRAVLLGKYHTATQQALVNAGFMRSNELMVLQALFLYLLCVRQYIDPRSLFCLIGLAVRIATRLGLHRDGAHFGLPPFEAEQRRRLWWQIVIFDKRTAEITGSTNDALSSSGCDTRMPLNINDADLNVHAKTQPASYAGPTEMVFCLTRIELTVAGSPDSVRQSVLTPGGRPLHKPTVHYSPAPSSPDLVTHVANSNLPSDLASFCSYMENYYLKHCDPKIPLHYFTLLMTRQALCKLRVIDFLCRTSNTENVDRKERDSHFMEALRTVEYDNLLQSSEMLQGFRWYTYQHFPLPAYLCLVSELRHRTTGELCERAWDVMIENHERRGLLKRNLNSPLHIAFGHYFIKAWDAREAAELQLGRSLPTPKIVVLLRNMVSKWRRPVSHPAHPQQQQVEQQVPVQSPLKTPAGNAAVLPTSSPMGDVGACPTGLPPAVGICPGKPMPRPPTSVPQMGGVGAAGPGLMMDNSMVFSGFDNMNQMFGNPQQAAAAAVDPSAMPDVQFEQMDWNYLVQYSAFGGYNPGYYPQGAGG